jgi:hypothetical protein
MSWNSTTCPHHGTYDFYGRHVPPCPRCGWPELKTADEYYRSMGVEVTRLAARVTHAGESVYNVDITN